jgi:hypothetical protein
MFLENVLLVQFVSSVSSAQAYHLKLKTQLLLVIIIKDPRPLCLPRLLTYSLFYSQQ